MGGLSLGFMTGVVQGVGQRQFEKRQSAHLAALEDRKLENWKKQNTIEQEGRVSLAQSQSDIKAKADIVADARKRQVNQEYFFSIGMSTDNAVKMSGITPERFTEMKALGYEYNPDEGRMMDVVQRKISSNMYTLPADAAAYGMAETSQAYAMLKSVIQNGGDLSSYLKAGRLKGDGADMKYVVTSAAEQAAEQNASQERIAQLNRDASGASITTEQNNDIGRTLSYLTASSLVDINGKKVPVIDGVYDQTVVDPSQQRWRNTAAGRAAELMVDARRNGKTLTAEAAGQQAYDETTAKLGSIMDYTTGKIQLAKDKVEYGEAALALLNATEEFITRNRADHVKWLTTAIEKGVLTPDMIEKLKDKLKINDTPPSATFWNTGTVTPLPPAVYPGQPTPPPQERVNLQATPPKILPDYFETLVTRTPLSQAIVKGAIRAVVPPQFRSQPPTPRTVPGPQVPIR